MIDINHIQIKQSGETVCLIWKGTSNVRLLLNGIPCFIQNSNTYQTGILPLFEPLAFELIDSDSKTRIVTALVSSTDDLFWNRKMTVLIQQDDAVRLLWGEISEVSHYTVFQDGHRLGQTTTPEWKGTIDSEQFTRFEIRVLRPISKKSISFANMIETIARVTNQIKQEQDREREFEQFVLYFSLYPLSASNTKLASYRLRVLTFIAPPILVNPNPFSPHRYFEGDARQYSPFSKEYRTFTEVLTCDGETTHQLSKQANPTRSFDARHQLYREDVASTQRVYLSNQSPTRYTLHHSVSNPLVVSPNIDYEIKVAHRSNLWRIAGTHLQSPHHEVYLDEGDDCFETIHQAHDLGLSFLGDPLPSCHWLHVTNQ